MEVIDQLLAMLQSVPDFFVSIFYFLNTGIVEFFVSFGNYIMDGLVCLFLKICLLMINFLWSVFRVLLVGLDITSKISGTYAYLNSDMVNTLLFFKIPDALNMLLAAFITRFVIRLIPFVG